MFVALVNQNKQAELHREQELHTGTDVFYSFWLDPYLRCSVDKIHVIGMTDLEITCDRLLSGREMQDKHLH